MKCYKCGKNFRINVGFANVRLCKDCYVPSHKEFTTVKRMNPAKRKLGGY